MVTTRRANGIVKPSSKVASADTSPSSSQTLPPRSPPSGGSNPSTMPSNAIPPPTHSPFLPTSTETLLLSIYPITLFLGSLFSHLNPHFYPPQNESTYSVDHQSFQPPSSAPSYFAQKRNVFNVYFVKIGWFWCTLAFFLFLGFVGRGRPTPPLSKTSHARQEADDKLRRRYQALLRYLVATGAWVLTTQWAFGAPLIDRGFALTGGKCEIAAARLEAGVDSTMEEKIQTALTHAACSAAKGQWRGGYDISGHVFLLVLGSGMLWMEIMPYLLPTIKGLGVGRVVRAPTGETKRIAHELEGAHELYVSEKEKTSSSKKLAGGPTIRTYATTLTLGIAVLSWWMLLMTAAFFHTWFEKLTGLLLAMTCLWVVYFLPRGIPAVRGLLGLPGV